MEAFAQCWILTVEFDEEGVAHGLLTVCGTTTNGAPESYEFESLSSASFQEPASVLDATMWSFLAIGEESLRFSLPDR